MKQLLLTVSALILSSSLSFADIAVPPSDHKGLEEYKAEMKAHMEKLKVACSTDVAATGCKDKGREVMKCVHEYKKTNKDFKFSEGCREAMKAGHEMRKERKMARKEHVKQKQGEPASPAPADKTDKK